jgi:hypothetical protein
LLVIVDDGTGSPTTELLSSVANAVEAVRPIGTRFAVVVPQVMTVNVSLTAQFATADATTVAVSRIQNQIAIYLNGLSIGGTASVTRIAQQAYQAESMLLNVSGVTLNAGMTDIVPPTRSVIKAGQIVVSIR